MFLEDRLLLGVTDAAGPGWGQSLAADVREKDGIARFIGRGSASLLLIPKAR